MGWLLKCPCEDDPDEREWEEKIAIIKKGKWAEWSKELANAKPSKVILERGSFRTEKNAR
jgi:hypothetical protein